MGALTRVLVSYCPWFHSPLEIYQCPIFYLFVLPFCPGPTVCSHYPKSKCVNFAQAFPQNLPFPFEGLLILNIAQVNISRSPNISFQNILGVYGTRYICFVPKPEK